MRRSSPCNVPLRILWIAVWLSVVVWAGGQPFHSPCWAGTASVFGYLVGNDGTPPQGGRLFIAYLDGPDGFFASQDSQMGFFFFGGLSPGRYALSGDWFDAGGVKHQSELLVLDLVEGDDRGPVQLCLDQTGTLRTTILGVAAPPRLWILPRGVGAQISRYAPYSGASEYLTSLRAGEYEVYAEADINWRTQTEVVRVASGQERSVSLIFPQGGQVSGTVRDGDGTLVKGARVYLDWRNGGYWGIDITGNDGRFSFGGLFWAPGPHTIWAEKDAFAVIPNTFQLSSGGSVEMPLTLEPRGSISGRVTSGGVPIGWAKVQVMMGPDSDDYLVSVTGDDQGNYLLQEIPPGIQTLRAFHPSGLTISRSVTLPAGGALSGIDFDLPASLDISVRVIDWQGNPVEGAEVAISHPDVRFTVEDVVQVTDPSGTVVFAGFPRLNGYRISIRTFTPAWPFLPLFRVGPVIVDVDESNHDFDFRLPQPASLSGSVDALLPDPTSVEVVMVLEGGASFRTPVELQGGSLAFSFQGLPPGECQVFALETQTPYRFGRVEHFILGPGEDRTGLVLVVGHGGTIAGKVLDSDGAPVADADVTLTGDSTGSTKTDSSGGFSFSFLGPGTYQVEARKGLMGGDTVPVTMAEGQQVTVTLTVPKGGVIHGMVTYASGMPVAGAWVELFMGGENGYLEQTADASGLFRFDFLPAAGYWIHGGSPVGTLSAGVEVSLAPGETMAVEIVLPPGAAISGSVIDCFGQPVAGATVDLSGSFQRVTNAQGAFSFEDLAQGGYVLQGSKSGKSSSQVWIILAEGEQRSGISLMLNSTSSPEVTYCYPHFWNSSGELVVGPGGFTYVRIYVHPKASGASMDPSSVKVWLDGTEVDPGEIRTYQDPSYGWLSVTYSPSPPEKLLGPHRVEFAAGDDQGNCTRYLAAITGVHQAFFRSFSVSPILFSPNADGFLDTLTLRVEPSVTNQVMIYARVLGKAPVVQLVPIGGGVWGAEFNPGRLETGSYNVIFYGNDYNHRDELGNPIPFVETSFGIESDVTPPISRSPPCLPPGSRGRYKGPFRSPTA